MSNTATCDLYHCPWRPSHARSNQAGLGIYVSRMQLWHSMVVRSSRHSALPCGQTCHGAIVESTGSYLRFPKGNQACKICVVSGACTSSLVLRAQPTRLLQLPSLLRAAEGKLIVPSLGRERSSVHNIYSFKIGLPANKAEKTSLHRRFIFQSIWSTGSWYTESNLSTGCCWKGSLHWSDGKLILLFGGLVSVDLQCNCTHDRADVWHGNMHPKDMIVPLGDNCTSDKIITRVTSSCPQKLLCMLLWSTPFP